MNLRDFLDQREKALTERIAEHRRQQIPYGAELAEILRAKTALTPAPDSTVATNDLRRYLSNREQELRQEIDGIAGRLGEAEIELAELHRVKESIAVGDGSCAAATLPERDSASAAAQIPYESISIKELIIRALTNEFPDGAVIGALLKLFREKWGRNIERHSLSPQLSRLYRSGVIGRGFNGMWFLVDGREPQGGDTIASTATDESGAVRKPYKLLEKAFHNNRIMPPGSIVMLLPHEVGPHHEPVIAD